MEVERAELLQFAFLEMFRHGGIGLELLDKIRVVAAGVFDFPGFHRGILAKFVGGFAGETFLDQREQDGLAVPHAEREAEVLLLSTPGITFLILRTPRLRPINAEMEIDFVFARKCHQLARESSLDNNKLLRPLDSKP